MGRKKSNNKDQEAELVWKALADGTRRKILDTLAEGPMTTGQLVSAFSDLCRTNVMKHLDALQAASLITVRREGRIRWNYLNPVPIQRVCDRWVSKYVQRMSKSISTFKDHLESKFGD